MPVHNILRVSRIYSKYFLHSPEVYFLETNSVTLSWSIPAIYVGCDSIHCSRENYSLCLKQWLYIYARLCLLCICWKSIYRINNNNNNNNNWCMEFNKQNWIYILKQHSYIAASTDVVESYIAGRYRCSIVIPPISPFYFRGSYTGRRPCWAELYLEWPI